MTARTELMMTTICYIIPVTLFSVLNGTDSQKTIIQGSSVFVSKTVAHFPAVFVSRTLEISTIDNFECVFNGLSQRFNNETRCLMPLRAYTVYARGLFNDNYFKANVKKTEKLRLRNSYKCY